MNLVDVVIPGERTPSIAGHTVTLPLPEAATESAVPEMPVPGSFRFETPELPTLQTRSLSTPAEDGALA